MRGSSATIQGGTHKKRLPRPAAQSLRDPVMIYSNNNKIKYLIISCTAANVDKGKKLHCLTASLHHRGQRPNTLLTVSWSGAESWSLTIALSSPNQGGDKK
jgi:hypothetical protein